MNTFGSDMNNFLDGPEPLEEIDDFTEAPVPHGELVVLIAKGVGFLVAIVAIFLGIIVMMLAKMVISYFISVFGPLVVLVVLCIASFATIQLKKASFQTMWVLLTRSCN